MQAKITIEQPDNSDEGVNLGISATGDPMEVFEMLLKGAEMIVYQMVRDSLVENGASELEADYAAPLRTRLLALEIFTKQEITPYSWVSLDLGPNQA
jgi:hypothetical protein